MKLVTRFIPVIALALSSAGLTDSAAAEPAEVERVFNVNIFVNACNGERVLYQGTAVLLTKELPDGRFLQKYLFHGTGIGSQGNEYEVNARQHNITDEFDEEYRTNLFMVSKGAAPNQEVSYYFNSATGETELESVCKG
jgi:hypothetical protein